MEIETKAISTESIRPSSPTPKSLQKYHLSFIDQGLPPMFMPIVYFYTSGPKIPNSQKSDRLKKSLSETLSTYYPLAGRLAGNCYINCNDAGVPFSEAEANSALSKAISDPNPDKLTKFLPYKTRESQDLFFAVQATYFQCGGVALGLLISHQIADALSIIMFVNTWSAVARNGDIGGLPIPRFDGAAYFPPAQGLDLDPNLFNKETMKEEIVSMMFTFPATQISLLQEKYSDGGRRRRPSRVEALTAHILTRLMRSGPNKTYSFLQTVNLRNRINDLPPSEYHFGNFAGVTTGTAEGGAEILKKIHEANKSGYESFMDLLKEAREKCMSWIQVLVGQHFDFERVDCTSLCGFPIYEADFGWGKLVRVRLPGFPVGNMIIFTPTKSGGGIEVNIFLPKQDIDKFEAEFELQPVLQSNL